VGTGAQRTEVFAGFGHRIPIHCTPHHITSHHITSHHTQKTQVSGKPHNKRTHPIDTQHSAHVHTFTHNASGRFACNRHIEVDARFDGFLRFVGRHFVLCRFLVFGVAGLLFLVGALLVAAVCARLRRGAGGGGVFAFGAGRRAGRSRFLLSLNTCMKRRKRCSFVTHTYTHRNTTTKADVTLTSPQSTILTCCLVLPLEVPSRSILRTKSNPSITLPNT
jgi:hypothetical protein